MPMVERMTVSYTLLKSAIISKSGNRLISWLNKSIQRAFKTCHQIVPRNWSRNKRKKLKLIELLLKCKSSTIIMIATIFLI